MTRNKLFRMSFMHLAKWNILLNLLNHSTTNEVCEKMLRFWDAENDFKQGFLSLEFLGIMYQSGTFDFWVLNPDYPYFLGQWVFGTLKQTIDPWIRIDKTPMKQRQTTNICIKLGMWEHNAHTHVDIIFVNVRNMYPLMFNFQLVVLSLITAILVF